MSLHGRTALVSGAGRGIGRAIAAKLAAHGASVVVNDLDEGPAAETVALIEAAGGRAKACEGDITAADFPDRFVTTAVDVFGGVDIVVNNAGFTWDAVIQKMTDEQWSTIMDVHLNAPFRILRAVQPVISAAIRAERAAGGPGAARCRKVVNVSSVAGTGGSAGQANYSAAKAGLLGLTRSLAKEWGRYNVCVNGVVFGMISTRLTTPTTIDVAGREITIGVDPGLQEAAASAIPLGRAGTVEDAAGAVNLLCGPDSDYITGQTLLCTGGLPW